MEENPHGPRPPRRSRVLWSADEDARLLHAVESQGAVGWDGIAAEVGSRKAWQCRERWHNHLKPGLVKSKWSAREDATLLHLVKEHGQKWGDFTRAFPGRSNTALKNRFHQLRRLPNRRMENAHVLAPQHGCATGIVVEPTTLPVAHPPPAYGESATRDHEFPMQQSSIRPVCAGQYPYDGQALEETCIGRTTGYHPPQPPHSRPADTGSARPYSSVLVPAPNVAERDSGDTFGLIRRLLRDPAFAGGLRHGSRANAAAVDLLSFLCEQDVPSSEPEIDGPSMLDSRSFAFPGACSPPEWTDPRASSEQPMTEASGFERFYGGGSQHLPPAGVGNLPFASVASAHAHGGLADWVDAPPNLVKAHGAMPCGPSVITPCAGMSVPAAVRRGVVTSLRPSSAQIACAAPFPSADSLHGCGISTRLPPRAACCLPAAPSSSVFGDARARGQEVVALTGSMPITLPMMDDYHPMAASIGTAAMTSSAHVGERMTNVMMAQAVGVAYGNDPTFNLEHQHIYRDSSGYPAGRGGRGPQGL
eukprot:CAMPEP_0206044954 /NCGR_PEP_ID=MMETSP1466-20131121/14510_1 /ASSEMBLY_ACC=CAM_ASM_001126 /TAXON_ID=44452 /ORGANISM="Pavlova gyrans, Strain CCMP608" /LENGTH=532 /DNA_ID=CAMNT_0053419871 /DNA_START=45 /DNA_END=1643 /DNA_ORIENTATION=-